VRRRKFIAGLGGAAVWPMAARAQRLKRMRRIGVLENRAADDPELQAESHAVEWGARRSLFR
jgi:putative ABC transport system substrate-binding protein